MSRVTVEVFFSQTCPHCPAQKELAQQFESEEVKVRMTDVARNQGRAEKHGVRAVPTTVIDGPGTDQKIGMRGNTTEERLENAIEVAKGEKDETELQSPTLVSKLKNLLGWGLSK